MDLLNSRKECERFMQHTIMPMAPAGRDDTFESQFLPIDNVGTP